MVPAKAIAACLCALLLTPATAAAQKSAQHAEECTEAGWGYLKSLRFEFGTVNSCSYAVTVWFKLKDQEAMQADVEPGQHFVTGLNIETFEPERQANGWLAATCPVGMVPSIAVSDDNWDAILESNYECRRP